MDGKLNFSFKLTNRAKGLIIICISLQFLRFIFILNNGIINLGSLDSRHRIISKTNSVVHISPRNPTQQFYASTSKSSRLCYTPLHSKLILSATVDITIVTLVGESGRKKHPGYLNFLRSLQINGYTDTIILSPPKNLQEIRTFKRTNYSGEANFWRERLKKFINVLAKFSDNKILLFCDSLDVYFTLPPHILLNRFHSIGKGVVFATEVLCDTVSCRTDVDLKDFFSYSAPKNNSYKYLNAGIFMGNTRDLKTVLSCALKFSENGRDDQNSFSMCYRLHNDIVGLDYSSLLFGNIPPMELLYSESWAESVQEINGISTTLVLRKVGSQHDYYPAAFHFLGMSYRDDLPFVPCQQFLWSKYNLLGGMIQYYTETEMKYSRTAYSTSRSSDNRHILLIQANLRLDSSNIFKELKHNTNNFCLNISGVEQLRISSSSISLNFRSNRVDQVYVSALVSASVSRSHSNLEVKKHILAQKQVIEKCLKVNMKQWLGSSIDPVVKVSLGNEYLKDTRKQFRGFNSSYETNGEMYEDVSENILSWIYSAEEFDLARQIQLNKETMLIVVSGNHKYGPMVISSLINNYNDNPYAAYGHSGLLVDIDVDNHAAYMRSAGHWTTAAHVVDILKIDGGVIYNFNLFASILNQTTEYNAGKKYPLTSGGCFAKNSFDILLSGYLATLKIPRIQLSTSVGLNNIATEIFDYSDEISYDQVQSLNHDVSCDNFNVSSDAIPNQSSSPTSAVSSSPIMSYSLNLLDCSDGRFLIEMLKFGWNDKLRWDYESIVDSQSQSNISYPSFSANDEITASNINSVSELKYCREWNAQFKPIPSRPKLNGFSWKQNWNSRTATSPCTCHLFTRISDNSLFVGSGQYMGENQSIISANGRYVLSLNPHANLCAYELNQNISLGHSIRTEPIKCISPPADLMKSVSSNLNHYVALSEGEICFYNGKTPHFGGNAAESGHKEELWCTTLNKNNKQRLLMEIEKSSSSFNLREMFKQKFKLICKNLFLGEEWFDELILAIDSSDGTLGLFLPQSGCFSHNICSPEKRLEGSSLMRCFW